MLDVFYYLQVVDVIVDSTNVDSLLLQAERLVDVDYPGISVHSLYITSDTSDFPTYLDGQDWPSIRRSFLLEIGFVNRSKTDAVQHHAFRIYDWRDGASRIVYVRPD